MIRIWINIALNIDISSTPAIGFRLQTHKVCMHLLHSPESITTRTISTDVHYAEETAMTFAFAFA